MTTIVLVRHSSVDAIGNWLAGRRLGLPLNDHGLNEATTLVDRMACFPITAIYSSPMQRAVETASPLAQRLNLEIRVRDEFNELDFGEWTGKTFDELDSLNAWRRFNQFRATASIPGGESMLAVAARMVTGIESLRELHHDHHDHCVAIFSHADPIRAAIAHYVGMHLDFLPRIDIDLASISVLKFDPSGAKLLKLNDTGQSSSHDTAQSAFAAARD